LNVAVTVVLLCNEKVQTEPLLGQPPDQPANEEPTGVAVRVTVVPLGKLALQLPAELAQLSPTGELATVPEPAPAKSTVRIGPPPPPVPVKQTTFAVIVPVTIAPDEDNPPTLLFVVTVAETREPPQAKPVAVNRPVELTVNICVSFEAQVTWFVMSLVTGGWMYEPSALSCTAAPALAMTGIFVAPKVSIAGWTAMDTNC